MINKEKRSFKEIFGWAMFDFANSSYTTVIITVVFGIIFTKLLVGPDSGSTGDLSYRYGNLLWSIALAISYVLVFISAPILGAMTDLLGSKKRFLFYSYLLTVISTALLYFSSPNHYWLAFLLLIISNVGFASGENFASSILPDLAPREELGKISGYAWGLGYFGGLASTVLVLTIIGKQSVENYSQVRLLGPITGAFFLIAGIPTFLWLKEYSSSKLKIKKQNHIKTGINQLKQTLKEIRVFKDLMLFLVSILFSQAGLAIIITFTFIYGDQVIKWEPSVQAMTFAITQITAALGAILFGFLQDKIGPKKTYNYTLILWTITIVLIFSIANVTNFINKVLQTDYQMQYIFMVIGSLAGLSLGATQSSGRAIIAILSPQSKSGEFFGFWGLATKLASFIGLIAIGSLQAIFGLQNALLVSSIFFVGAFLVSMKVNITRGKEDAKAYTPPNA